LIPLDETVEILITQEGKTTLYHEAFDVAGNDSNDGSNCLDPWNDYRVGDQQEIKIDKTEPKLYKLEFGTKGDNGWYISPVKVRLTATDFNSGTWRNPVESSGVDYITYQIEGSAPVTSDAPMGFLWRDDDQGPQIWSAPPGLIPFFFTIDREGITTLYHEAFDVAGNDSDYSGPSYYVPILGYRVGDSQQLKIDLTDPGLTKTLLLPTPDGKNGWYVTPVQVTLTATDATSGVYDVQYSINGVPVTVLSGAEGTPLLQTQFDLTADNTYKLTHQTSDYAGHTTTVDPQQVKIDQTAPDLTKDLRLTQLNEVTVTLTGRDARSGVGSIQYSIDGGTTWQTVQCTGGLNGTATFTLTGIGDHELGHLVFDVAGNQYELPAQIVSIVGGGTTGMPTTALVITVDVMGTVASYEVSPDGTLLEDALITSPDGKVRLFILAGTRLLNADGTTPTYLNDDPDIVIKLAGTPPTPPGYQMVAAYECLPSGITFSKDANLIIEYDPDKLPADSTPIIAYYNETAGEWEPLETAGYVAGGIEQPNTVTSHIAHLSYYAVFAKIATAK
jgi:hypothetical protein